MKILFLGGTRFVGRYLVEAALARGHQVTLFHRGQTNPGLFPQAEELFGDRDGGLDRLSGRSWDAVVDVNGYVPRIVRASAEFLRGAVEQYLFISTASVYNDRAMKAFGGEESTLETLEDSTTEDYRGPAYGGLKVLCEHAVQEVFPEKYLIQRLGVVAGPHDPSDRLTYWVERVARGGEILVPGHAGRRIQFIDARDMASFAMDGLEKHLVGIYNTVGNSVFWSHFLDACWQAAGRPELQITWVDDAEFLETKLPDGESLTDSLPLTAPPELDVFFTHNNDRALAQGLVFRSTLNTARDVLDWERTRPPDYAWRTGVSGSEEHQLLEKWHQMQGFSSYR